MNQIDLSTFNDANLTFRIEYGNRIGIFFVLLFLIITVCQANSVGEYQAWKILTVVVKINSVISIFETMES